MLAGMIAPAAAVASLTRQQQQTPGQDLDASLAAARTLEQRVNALERENERLRAILRREGITDHYHL